MCFHVYCQKTCISLPRGKSVNLDEEAVTFFLANNRRHTTLTTSCSKNNYKSLQFSFNLLNCIYTYTYILCVCVCVCCVLCVCCLSYVLREAILRTNLLFSSTPHELHYITNQRAQYRKRRHCGLMASHFSFSKKCDEEKN